MTQINVRAHVIDEHAVMSDLFDAIALAEYMIATFGDEAFAILAQRVIAHHTSGDREGAAMWQNVAEAARILRAPGPRAPVRK